MAGEIYTMKNDERNHYFPWATTAVSWSHGEATSKTRVDLDDRRGSGWSVGGLRKS